MAYDMKALQDIRGMVWAGNTPIGVKFASDATVAFVVETLLKIEDAAWDGWAAETKVIEREDGSVFVQLSFD